MEIYVSHVRSTFFQQDLFIHPAYVVSHACEENVAQLGEGRTERKVGDFLLRCTLETCSFHSLAMQATSTIK